MKRRIRRLVLTASGTALVAGMSASAALAAETTQPATNITTSTAVLHGIVNTGNLRTAWEFQYGTTSAYGKVTEPRLIPAGKGAVAVSFKLTRLKSGTTYHYRLTATGVAGNYHYPGVGSDLSFTTKVPGKPLLRSSTIHIKHETASVGLKCSSPQSCKGKLTITTRSAKKTVSCVSKAFSIGAGKKSTLKAKVSGKCDVLVAKARTLSIKGLLKTILETGQSGLKKTVTLTLK